MPKDIKKRQENYISPKCSVEGIMSPLNVSWKTWNLSKGSTIIFIKNSARKGDSYIILHKVEVDESRSK